MRGEADRGAVGQGRRPQRHQRVAVEQRHAAVVHIATVVAELLGCRVRDAGQPTLRAPHRLRRAGGAGGEQQQQECCRVDTGGSHVGSAAVFVDEVPVSLVIDAPDPFGVDAVIEGVQPVRARGVGHDHRAVGMPDVGRQILRAASRIEADDGRTGQRRTTEPEHELGHIGQQHPDVTRCAVGHSGPLRTRQRCAGRRTRHHFVPGPGVLSGAQPGMGVT